MSEAAHTIRLLEGKEYFPALFEAFDAAKEEIRIEVYVFRLDSTGHATLDRLGAAVRRGVRVFLTLDGLGSPEVTPANERIITDLGIQLVVYRRPRHTRVGMLHGRMHRKILAVDRRVLFLGGMNISDEYAGLDVPGAFYDLSVRVEGPVAEEAAALAERLFVEERLKRGERWWRIAKRTAKTAFRRRGRARAGPTIRLVYRDNIRAQKDIEHVYRDAMRSARRTLTLAHAYFLPSRSFVEAIAHAAKRGVRTTLILQGAAEHPVLRWAERRLYDRMLRAGVRIFEYESCLLHAKVGVVDSRWSTIGSSNLEPWSLISNLEANLVIEDEALAKELEAALERNTRSACRAFEMRRLGPLTRFLSMIAYEVVLGVFVITGGRRDKRWRSIDEGPVVAT